MDNNQSTQQSSEYSALKLAQSSRSSRLTSAWNFLISLLKHYPWLIWSGVWLFLLATTATALFSLTHGGRVAQKEPQPTLIGREKPVETSSQTGNDLPLWLLGAVALTCAGGYLVIAKRLNSSPPPIRQPVKRSSARMPTRRQRRKQLLQEHSSVPTPPETMPPVVPSVPAKIETVVTVLPPEQSHPLDSDEESLAEMMDIRKHRSLSSLLGETFKKE